MCLYKCSHTAHLQLCKLDWKVWEGMVVMEAKGQGVTEGAQWHSAASALQAVELSLILRF